MPAATDYLLIDNSNSSTKMALGTKDGVLQRQMARIPTPDLTVPVLQQRVQRWRFRRVILCSVVPAAVPLFREAFRDHPVTEVSYRSVLGVAIDYPKPSTIGADRLANAAAAIAFYGKPSVIVDFGTAVTFDIINASGAYVGGVIAPGLEALTDYLHLRTALLPRVRIAEPPAAIGRSTKHAMLSGCVHGYRGLVRGILTEIRAELRARRLVVAATGGYGEMIAAGIREITHVHPHLTLEGLRLIGNLNPLTST